MIPHVAAGLGGVLVGLAVVLFVASRLTRLTVAEAVAEWRHGPRRVTVAGIVARAVHRTGRVSRSSRSGAALEALRSIVASRLMIAEIRTTADSWLVSSFGLLVVSIVLGVGLAVWQQSPMFFLLALGVPALRWVRLSRNAKKRVALIDAELPVTIALLGIAAGIRSSFDGEGGALAALARHVDSPGVRLLRHAAESAEARSEGRAGQPIEHVLEAWGVQYDLQGLRALARAITMTRAEGVGLESSLQQLAQDLTDRQMDQVVRRAAARVVMALIPFVIFDLPALLIWFGYPGASRALAGFGHG